MNNSIQILASVARRRSAAASALDHILEPGDAHFQHGVDSPTSLRRIGWARRRPSLVSGTIVTNEEDIDDYGHSPEDVEQGRGFLQADDYDISTYGVPAEVTLLQSDGDGSHHDGHRDSDSESELDAGESEEKSEDEGESKEEEKGSSDDDGSVESETDEDSVESERSNQGSEEDKEDSMNGAPRRSAQSDDSAGSDMSSRHELFLPWNVSPSTETLKYEEDSDENSDEDNDDVTCFHRRTSMMGRGGRPRMWDGFPSSISISSNSSSSSEGSRHSKKRKRAGVSFSDSVTVYPTFHSEAYPPSVVKRMYTKREELRVNRIRSRKEFAYDMYDWRNATEEDDMEPNELGELIHPVHSTEKINVRTSPPSSPWRSPRKVVQTYSSALGGYQTYGTFHRAKRMRLYYS